jgi:uncharacterized protein (TIGR03086 family)
MSEIADRYRNVAGGFTSRVAAVPATAWDNPSPCEGWVARDVVRHLVEWVPPFLAGGADIDMPSIPSVDDDPVGAWRALDAALQGLLDDPVASQRTFDNPHTGTHRLDDAIGMFVLGDVLVHTWDVARATGLEETLDRDEVRRMLAGVEPLGDALAQSGQYGPRVPVPDGADEQTRLLACTGRDPASRSARS